MPGPHLQITIFETFADVGGADLWLSSKEYANGIWYTGWHTPWEMASWYLTKHSEWELIGWEFWMGGHKSESFYVFPNPAMTPKHIYDRKAPKIGLEHNFYNVTGFIVNSSWVLGSTMWQSWSPQHNVLQVHKGNPKGGKYNHPKGRKGEGKDKGGPKGDKGGPKGGDNQGDKGGPKGAHTPAHANLLGWLSPVEQEEAIPSFEAAQRANSERRQAENRAGCLCAPSQGVGWSLADLEHYGPKGDSGGKGKGQSTSSSDGKGKGIKGS